MILIREKLEDVLHVFYAFSIIFLVFGKGVVSRAKKKENREQEKRENK